MTNYGETKMCKCGHDNYSHYPVGKKCQSLKDKGSWCTCTRFRESKAETS